MTTSFVPESREAAMPAGARFGEYRLIQRIGRGGMAVVYRAKMEGPNGFEKDVVVKTLLPQLARDRELLELFNEEAKTSAKLSHPGIVHVYDYGVMDGTPYLVMEHLAGTNLAQLSNALYSRKQRLPTPIAIVMMTQVCHALGYAHNYRDEDGQRRQIIHGDVSPSNILACRDGTVKLLDFGVARVLDEFGFDVSNTLKGKFAYMAPERVNRQPFDRRVDVFAAGVVLYELLTMRRLFSAATDLETLLRVKAATVEPPSRTNPEVSPEIDAVVLKALARDPGERYDSGEDMAEALEEVARIGGGRRRVAEYLATVFPEDWYVPCRACGRRVVPGMICRNCGTETKGAKWEGEATRIDSQRPRLSRPPSLTRIVLPPREPAPGKRRRSPWVALAVGTSALAVTLAGTVAVMLSRSAPAAAIVVAQPAMPLSIETLPTVEIPEQPAEPPAPEPAPAPAPAVAVKKKHGRGKRSRAIVKPAQPAPAPAPTPAPPPPPRVKQGRLLDPFAAEEK